MAVPECIPIVHKNTQICKQSHECPISQQCQNTSHTICLHATVRVQTQATPKTDWCNTLTCCTSPVVLTGTDSNVEASQGLFATATTSTDWLRTPPVPPASRLVIRRLYVVPFLNAWEPAGDGGRHGRLRRCQGAACQHSTTKAHNSMTSARHSTMRAQHSSALLLDTTRCQLEMVWGQLKREKSQLHGRA